jgi:diguanylate cyclase (GGDEF)-like protein/PAS domain S-box-containing protein
MKCFRFLDGIQRKGFPGGPAYNNQEVTNMLLRADKKWLSLIAAYIAVFAVGNYRMGLTGQAIHWWADIFWTVAAFASSMMCFGVARRLSARRRTAWLFIGAGGFSWFLGMLIWDYLELIRRVITPFPALSDLGFMALPLCFIAGLFYYRNATSTTILTLNNASNLGIIISTIVICTLVAFFDEINRLDVPPGYKIAALAYPILYISAFLYAALVLVSRPWQDDSMVVLLLTLSLGAHTITNVFYAHSLLVQTYEAGNYLDIFWIAAFGLLGWAVLEQRGCLAQQDTDTSTLQADERIRHAEAMLPAMALALFFISVMLFGNKLTPGIIPYLLPFAGIFIAAVGTSEWSTRKLEMRLSNEALAAEARVRLLLDSTDEAIFGVDAEGRCTFANPACVTMLGWDDAQDLLGKNMAGLLFDSCPRESAADGTPGEKGSSLEHPAYLPDIVLRRRDGSRFYAELWSHPLRNDTQSDGAVVTFIDITQRRKAQADLVASEHELSNILSSMQDTYFRCDVDGRLTKISDSAVDLLGYKREELMRCDPASLFVDVDARARLLAALRRNGGRIKSHETRLRRKDGGIVWLSFNAQFIHDADGAIGGLEGTARDVSARKNAEEEMYKLSSALEQTADGVMITDRSGVIEYVNPAYTLITGYRREEMIGRQPSVIKSGKQGPEFYKGLWETITAGKAFSDVFINRKKSGALYYEAKTISPLKDRHGDITHYVATGKDITEQMETQQKLQHMAHHDALTELPNRALFIDRVKQALARARWHSRGVAILFLDLDRFKNINDSLGHDAGDRLLKQIGERLIGGLRDGDTVARFGGDEFVILLDDIAESSDISRIAGKILDVIAPSFSIADQELHITASMGISLFPGDGEDSQTLLKNADIAMYRAKEAGKNTYKFYSDEMSARTHARLTLENDLRNAINRDEFELYYQPQVDAASGTIVAVEALLRWRHPKLGLLAPAEFIPLLEETGLILPVGEWVVRSACEQAARWHAAGFASLRMSVNISARQFEERHFVEMLEKNTVLFHIDPRLLELEMTESVLMRNTRETIETVDLLSNLGFRLVIDDFGTGYSSLSYLRRFHIDMLKLDKSFVRDISHDPNDAALCSAIILLARSLNLDVVAEGVETPEQLEFLCTHGCHLVQGYLYSHALPVADVDALLRKSQLHPANNIALKG